jgi:hypothetical protein
MEFVKNEKDKAVKEFLAEVMSVRQLKGYVTKIISYLKPIDGKSISDITGDIDRCDGYIKKQKKLNTNWNGKVGDVAAGQQKTEDTIAFCKLAANKLTQLNLLIKMLDDITGIDNPVELRALCKENIKLLTEALRLYPHKKHLLKKLIDNLIALNNARNEAELYDDVSSSEHDTQLSSDSDINNVQKNLQTTVLTLCDRGATLGDCAALAISVVIDTAGLGEDETYNQARSNVIYLKYAVAKVPLNIAVLAKLVTNLGLLHKHEEAFEICQESPIDNIAKADILVALLDLDTHTEEFEEMAAQKIKELHPENEYNYSNLSHGDAMQVDEPSLLDCNVELSGGYFEPDHSA